MLESISLRNFRIHKSTDISPIGDFCALVGKNDVGKSSVLQALDILLKGEDPSMDDRQDKGIGITIEASIDGTVYKKNPNTVNYHYFTAENFSDASIEGYTISELIDSKEDISFALQRANKFREDILNIFSVYQNVSEIKSELDYFQNRYGLDEDIDIAQIDRVYDIIDQFLELRDVNILACDDNLKEIEQCEWLTQGINVDQEVYHQIVNDIGLNITNLDDTSDLYDQLCDFINTGDSSIIYNLDEEDIEDEYGNDVRDFVVELKNKLNKSLLVGRINIADIGFFNQFPKYESLLLAGSLDGILTNQDKVMADVDAFIQTYLDSDIVAKWSMILRELGKTSTNIKIAKRGSGVKRLCSLFNYAVEQYRSVSVDGKQTIFAIDEPEISLHPSQQRELTDRLKEISAYPNIQVLITTHSPYVVRQLQKDNIVVLKEDKGIIKSDTMGDRLISSYFSLSEINYIAFEEPSIEYHQELFGLIQSCLNLNVGKVNSELAQMPNAKKHKYYATDDNGNLIENADSKKAKRGKYQNGDFTLPYCVRNAVDHPVSDNEKDADIHSAFDNNNECRMSETIIKDAIDMMRDFIKSKPIEFKL